MDNRYYNPQTQPYPQANYNPYKPDKVSVKPTWGLAWGLLWRMWLLCIPVYAVLAFFGYLVS